MIYSYRCIYHGKCLNKHDFFNKGGSILMIGKILTVLIGCSIVALGVRFLSLSQLVTGGTAGLSLSIGYLTGLSFGSLFFVINLPFYILSIWRMGKRFTINTIVCVTILSVLSDLCKHLPLSMTNPWLSSILGGGCIGVGLIIIFRVGGSLGGANILALYLQQRFKLNAGLTNFLFDCVAVVLGCIAVGWNKGPYSFVAICITGVLVSQYKNPTVFRLLRPVRSVFEQ
jgi:uncharacterized membrane-anchored protein YitT (DUF2179 family)